MSAAHFDWKSVVARVLFSLFVVFAVYNPSGRSYWHWLWDGAWGFWPKLTVGLMLALAHAAIWMTLLGLLRWRGVLLVALTATSAWVSVSQLIGLGSAGWDGVVVVPLGILSMVYAAGLSWSAIHHRIAGITHVEQLK